MLYLVFLGIALVASSLYSIIATHRSLKKRRADLIAQFGKPVKPRVTNFDSIATYWDYQKDVINPNRPESTDRPIEYSVDDITWNDLDMDSVFKSINACQTSVGEETLYFRLRGISGTDDLWEKNIDALTKHKDLRVNLQSVLMQMGRMDHNGVCQMFMNPKQYEPYMAPAAKICAFLPLVAAGLIFLVPLLGLLALVASIVANAIIYALYQKEVQDKRYTIRYLSSMLWCAEKIVSMQGADVLPIYNILKEAAAPFSRIKGRLSGVMQESVRSSDMAAMGTLYKILFLSEVRSYNKVIGILGKNYKKLKSVYEAIGALDVLLATLSYRKSMPTHCIPKFHSEMAIQADGMLHPLLKDGVENGVDIIQGTIITGSNASGKSTYIKAIAVNAILAQAINTCLADSFTLPRALVISSMALRDSILDGDSYFIAEIKSVKRILDASRRFPCLCFIDEILRGTNTIERIAASAAVLRNLVSNDCLTIVASHDIELTQILSGIYDNCHFEERVTDQGVLFDYKVLKGPSTTRNAIRLLETMGFDVNIINRADEMAARFEANHSWPQFDKIGDGLLN